MIISKISDGLGNQFFQYALGRCISIKRNTPLKLDISMMDKNNLRDYQLSKYNITNDNFTLLEKLYYIHFYKIIRTILVKFNLKNKIIKNIYWEKEELTFDDKIFDIRSHYLFGYWQDLRYFIEIRDTLINELTLKLDMNTRNTETLRKISDTNSISLHIRRGDYLNIKHQQVCDLSYYRKAINIIQEKVDNPVFFIFSDDINWVKDNLKIEFETCYIDFNQNTPEFDLELMKNCKHNIIANSTFSWWGAWLNTNKNKTVILPKYWRKDFVTPNGLIEKDWILI